MLLTGEGDKAYFNNRLLSLLQQNKNQDVIRMFETENPCNLADFSGKTLLHLSVDCGNIGIMEHLISLGANINAQDKQGNTPLAIAIKKGRIKSICSLLKANVDIYVADDTGKRQLLPLILRWAKKMYIGIVRLFFERIRLYDSADVNMITRELINAHCPLYCAVLLKNTSIMRALLNRKVAIGARCRHRGNTVLHVAVQFSIWDSVKLLFDYGIDVNMMNHSSETALMLYPIEDNTDENLEILKILLAKTTHLTSCNYLGKMQVYNLLKLGTRAIVKEVLDKMTDLTVKDTFRQTVLHYLMKNTNPDIVEELQGKKFDVNAIDSFGRSALHLAAARGISNNIRYLLSIGAEINIFQYANDVTPLFSIFTSNVELAETKKCVELLLRHGADIQFVTSQERTIFDEILDLNASPSNNNIIRSRQRHNFYVFKPILAYLALSESRGITTITELTLSKINTCDRMKKYFNFCRQKLKQMKKTIDPSLSTVFFKCLAESEERVMRLARDRKLALKLLRAINKFPTRTNYLIKLRKSLVKALRMSKLKMGAIPKLCKIKSLHSNQVVVDKIISYLTEEDLRILNQI